MANRKRLGDLLIESGKITEKQLDLVLSKQRTSGKRLGELLIDEKIITENDILDVLEVQLGIERVYLDEIKIDNKAVKSVPQSIALRYCLIPIGFRENRITIAMSDPLNIFAIDDVAIASGYEVDYCIASKREIEESIDKYYSSQYVQKAAEELTKARIAESISVRSITNLEDIKNAPAVKLVDSIINNAVKLRASDIHIEPFEDYVKVRCRVDGQLQEILRTSKDTLMAMITRIKILANLNIAEKRLPQDGRILTSVDDKIIDLRVSILPTVYGEKSVIRILNKENVVIKKEELGMSKNELKLLDKIIKSPYGIVLVTGPTGSGKTTTLYTVLNSVNSNDKNIVTIEDPVEYTLDGINQVNVNNKAGLNFAKGLRSILRQDPDIIMVGEIRDNETAEIAIRSAITGHLVLSTIHTNNAPSAIIRLIDMGIEPYLVATALSGVIAQRLVRKICPYCKEEYEANNYEKELLGLSKDEKLLLYKGKGCNYCGNSGYLGRTGVFEIMEMTREHREMILNNRSIDEVRELSVRKGMHTLAMECSSMVLEGETTVSELARIAFLKE